MARLVGTGGEWLYVAPLGPRAAYAALAGYRFRQFEHSSGYILKYFVTSLCGNAPVSGFCIRRMEETYYTTEPRARFIELIALHPAKLSVVYASKHVVPSETTIMRWR